ncbi:hypothetical protein [Variovorax sp. DT-64]|uniref:hypothetical protein n=1 Tax=Variovorax sp. DT-64 TaxID=3396160 RepID=UPI003F193843
MTAAGNGHYVADHSLPSHGAHPASRNKDASDGQALPDNCGWLNAPSGFFLAGKTARVRVPVPAYLIDHPRGKALFDTGLNLRFEQRVDASNTGLDLSSS